MLESDHTHAESSKPAPEVPVRVFLKSQLMAALRQHARPIVIEDPDLALPFTRMLRARELRLGSRWPRSRSDVICDQPALSAPMSRRTGTLVNMYFRETCSELF